MASLDRIQLEGGGKTRSTIGRCKVKGMWSGVWLEDSGSCWCGVRKGCHRSLRGVGCSSRWVAARLWGEGAVWVKVM